jgi:hypothetical protein
LAFLLDLKRTEGDLDRSKLEARLDAWYSSQT